MTSAGDTSSKDAANFAGAKSAAVTQANHLPGFVYTSPEVFAREKDQIFMKDWLCVGRLEEIEKTGDYMALRILEEPVVVVRGEGDTVNAFSNICAHRGVEVATGTGNVQSFTCPFHGWTYGLDGRLLGAPYMREAEQFEVKNCRLPPVRVGVWQGWIFISFDDNGPSLAEHVAPVERDFGFLHWEDCRLATKTVTDLDCNWKLVVENLIDFYHLNVVHTTTNGRTFTNDGFKFTPRENGGYVATYNSGPSTLSGKPVFGRAPWLDDKPDHFSVGGLLSPNMTLFARIDDIHPSISWPIAPNKTRIIVYTLLPKVYFGEPDFETRAKEYQDYQKQLMSEDAAMLESLQNGLASKRFQPGRMSYIERGVHHILKNYADRMFDTP